MSFMMAFGWASIMLCIGMFLRAKIFVFRNMLVPASVIAGIMGIIFINAAMGMGVAIGTDTEMYTSVANHLFTVSFISISLTSSPKGENNSARNVMKGAVSMGLIWCLLYGLTPLAATGVLYLMQGITDMNPGYGMLIQFAFCQGPGQAASYGAIFEQYGWENASMVAITFASIGFVVAFLIGIPAAKLGVRRGIAKNCGKIDEAILKGYFRREEQTEYMVKDTTCNSNIETLAYHFALIGLCYVLAVGIGKLLSYIPGFLGTSMSSMMFMNGMYAAYIVKWIIGKLHLDFLQENVLQSKITGWTADYLVVCAFMAVSVNVIREWMLPIIAVVIVITAVTFAVCFYFGQRIGGSNDFERTLGLYGTCTGTVPSGIALVRIIDPEFKTTTSVELGAMNLVMLACTPIYIFILGYAAGSMTLNIVLAGLAGCVAVYLILLKLTKSWGKKSYLWK